MACFFSSFLVEHVLKKPSQHCTDVPEEKSWELWRPSLTLLCTQTDRSYAFRVTWEKKNKELKSLWATTWWMRGKKSASAPQNDIIFADFWLNVAFCGMRKFFCEWVVVTEVYSVKNTLVYSHISFIQSISERRQIMNHCCSSSLKDLRCIML